MVSVDLIIVSSYVDYILVTDIDEKLITEFKVEMTDFGLLCPSSWEWRYSNIRMEFYVKKNMHRKS